MLKKNIVKPKYLWFTTFGSFINNERNFLNKDVLDFGCDIESNCYKQFLIQNNNSKNKYYGFDLSHTTINWLNENSFYYDFWLDNNKKFDVINASEVYEHLENELRENFLKRCFDLLKSGGVLYIDIPYIANLNIIEFFRRDRTHKPVACEDEAIYINQFGFETELFVGGYTVPYYGLFVNLYRIFTNLILGFKPFLVTFIIAKKINEK